MKHWGASSTRSINRFNQNEETKHFHQFEANHNSIINSFKMEPFCNISNNEYFVGANKFNENLHTPADK